MANLCKKIAIITGITGQDGAYLAELLLKKDYMVYGTFRRSSTNNFWRIKAIGIDKHPNLCLLEVDLTDLSSLINLLKKCNPHEFYNLAAQSFVASSFDQPTTTASITALGVLNILEAIKILDPRIRFYQASTSEMFGKVQQVPQDENTPFYPRSPYGVAKLYAHWITVNYRESYNIFACSGILFNHESPLRGKEFVTRKITDTLSRIKLGHHEILELGNLDAKRDWGYAKEYVEGMWKMLQKDNPDTYILATQRTETIRYFTELAAKISEIDLIWEGKEQEEVGVEKGSGKIIVKINPKFYRPAEVELLIGDASKAKKQLDWEPQTKLEELCEIMVKADLIRNKKLKLALNDRYEFS